MLKVENYNDRHNTLHDLEEQGKFLKEEYYDEVAELETKDETVSENDDAVYIEQLENLEPRIVIENNDNNEKLRDELNLVDLYPENYNENVSKKKKYGQTNSRVRARNVNVNNRKTFAQHEFDKKLSRIISKCIKENNYFKSLSNKQDFIDKFKRVVRYVKHHAENNNRYENAKEVLHCTEQEVHAVRDISKQIQLEMKQSGLWTGRNKNELDGEVKKAIVGEVVDDPNAGGMRLKDVRDDIIELAINDVLNNRSR